VRTPAELRRDRTAEIARLKTLSCKLRGIIASADECNGADRNGRVGNLAHDIHVLSQEIDQGALSLSATCVSISILDDAQRQAEIEHGPLIADLKAMIDGTRIVQFGRPANHQLREA